MRSSIEMPRLLLCQFPDAMLKFLESISRPTNSFAWESKSQEFSLVRFTNFALFSIDLEF